jgi:hypothetical protein
MTFVKSSINEEYYFIFTVAILQKKNVLNTINNIFLYKKVTFKRFTHIFYI